ncbi:MAG: nucleotidyltransferase domain-containing protein [Bacteroidales bacterium]|jgi:hypothetical protein|nr:nucleotidyltransferase domain-containing protein [Bacteroidales bacterium]
MKSTDSVRYGKKRSTAAITKIIANYFETQPVVRAWLFGSFARGEQTSESDVDILFVPDESGAPFTLLTMGGMYMDLSKLLGRKIDLVEEGTLKPSVEKYVDKDRILIYERKNQG